jgi:hypothetical protein
MNATGRHATCGTWDSFAAACCRYKKGTTGRVPCLTFNLNFNQRRQT